MHNSASGETPAFSSLNPFHSRRPSERGMKPREPLGREIGEPDEAVEPHQIVRGHSVADGVVKSRFD